MIIDWSRSPVEIRSNRRVNWQPPPTSIRMIDGISKRWKYFQQQQHTMLNLATSKINGPDDRHDMRYISATSRLCPCVIIILPSPVDLSVTLVLELNWPDRGSNGTELPDLCCSAVNAVVTQYTYDSTSIQLRFESFRLQFDSDHTTIQPPTLRFLSRYIGQRDCG